MGLLAIGMALLPGMARADAVTDWNALVSTAPVQGRFGGPPQQQRAQAMVHIAIHDALNSIHRRYDTYGVVPAAPDTASPDAAIAAAAYNVLLQFMPANAPVLEGTTTLQAYFASRVAGIPEPARSTGLLAGQAAAESIVTLRQGDGSATPHLPYSAMPARGVYQPTPNPEFPAQITPMFEGWASLEPFVMHSPSQFRPRPGKIFNLSKLAYALEYIEVKHVGSARVRGAAPDSEQSDIPRFWAGGGSNWNATARVILDGLDLDPWQHARLFALLNMAQSDVSVATMDGKYTYAFWRPVTAIRWSNDGNPLTIPDAGWRPFLVTPPYPDYPCNLPANTGAAAEVLRRVLGTDRIGFTRTHPAGALPLPDDMDPDPSDGIPAQLPPKAITRSFERLSDAEAEAAMSRVYAGIHFRSGCTAGLRLGNEVGRFVTRNALRPARGR